MSLFPLDTVRNAIPDLALEALLSDVRDEIVSFPFSGDRDVGDADEVIEAFDQSRARLNVITGLLAGFEGRTGADISAGIGFLSVLLQRRGLRVTATERDPELARFVAARGVPVERWSIGETPPPFARQSLDFLVFAEVLEHLKLSPIPVLEQLAALLRPGGRFILTTPNVARLSHIEALAAGENILEPFRKLPLGVDATDFVEHVREYSIREVVEAVEAAGLGVDTVLMTNWGDDGYTSRANHYSNDIMVLVATA